MFFLLKKDFIKTKEFSCVDYMKLLMACCVIGIHTNLSCAFLNTTAKEIVNLLFSMAVPYFSSVQVFSFLEMIKKQILIIELSTM